MNTLLRSLIALALVSSAPAARADGFSTTNIQLLQGYTFDNGALPPGLDNYDDGLLTTITLNTFSTWEWGDSFFFADLTRGQFGGEDATNVYAEWHPRLFLNSFLKDKKPLFGVVRRWGLAGEINLGGGGAPPGYGSGFYAYLAGLGVDFVAPKGWVLGMNVYYRYDKFAENQWQLSPFWTVPFSIAKVPLVFTGFFDLNGTKSLADEAGVEFWAQPQLLVDVLAPFGGKANRLYVGVEWYLHGYYAGPTDTLTSAPQIMAQWTIF
jgi:nucleoside-specific outer membrane channel protein Tsx